MTSGNYKIENTVNGKCYVGSAVDLDRRWRNHRSRLNRGKHHSIKLQRSWNKHTSEAANRAAHVQQAFAQ